MSKYHDLRASLAAQQTYEDAYWLVISLSTLLGLVLAFVIAIVPGDGDVSFAPVPTVAWVVQRLGSGALYAAGVASAYLLLFSGFMSLWHWRITTLHQRSQRVRDKAAASFSPTHRLPQLAARAPIEQSLVVQGGMGPSRIPLVVVGGEEWVYKSLCAAVSLPPHTARARIDEEAIRRELNRVVEARTDKTPTWRTMSSLDCARAIMIIEEAWHAEFGQETGNAERLQQCLARSARRQRVLRALGGNAHSAELFALRQAVRDTQANWPKNPNVVPSELEEALSPMLLAGANLTNVCDADDRCRIYLEMLNLQRLGTAQAHGWPVDRVHAEVRSVWHRLRHQVQRAVSRRDESIIDQEVDIRVQLDD